MAIVSNIFVRCNATYKRVFEKETVNKIEVLAETKREWKSLTK